MYHFWGCSKELGVDPGIVGLEWDRPGFAAILPMKTHWTVHQRG